MILSTKHQFIKNRHLKAKHVPTCHQSFDRLTDDVKYDSNEILRPHHRICFGNYVLNWTGYDAGFFIDIVSGMSLEKLSSFFSFCDEFACYVNFCTPKKKVKQHSNE